MDDTGNPTGSTEPVLSLRPRSDSLDSMRVNGEDPNNKCQASPVHEPSNIQDPDYPCDRDHQVDRCLQQTQPIPNRPLIAPENSTPVIIRQPETRPSSHDQLAVEVKRIYAGLVLVEQKCKEVDKKQMAAILGRDPTRKAPLSNKLRLQLREIEAQREL